MEIHWKLKVISRFLFHRRQQADHLHQFNTMLAYFAATSSSERVKQFFKSLGYGVGDVILREMLEKDASITDMLVHSRNSVNMTPLLFICKNVNSLPRSIEIYTQIVSTLLEFGSDVNAVDNSGMTPLHHACVEICKPIIEVLLRRGANISIECLFCWTPLHYASASGSIAFFLELCNELGIIVDVNIKSRYGKTPLHVIHSASTRDLTDEEKLHNLDILVVTNKADIHIKDNHFGKTPLNYWCDSRQKNIIECERLLRFGADPNSQCKRGYTPLIRSIMADRLDRVHFLLKWKADPNIVDTDGRNALDYALEKDVKFVMPLVRHGCKTDMISKLTDKSVLHFYIEEICFASGEYHAPKQHYYKKIVDIVKGGADIQHRDQSGHLALNYAIRAGNKYMLQHLLEKGSDFDVPQDLEPTEDWTPEEKELYKENVRECLELVKKEKLARYHAFLLCRHDRVGADSPAHVLNDDVLGIIARFVAL